MKDSPLFWPVTLKGQIIYCLDETALPGRCVYLKARTTAQAVRLIRDMKTRAVGQVIMAFSIFLLELKKNRKLPPERLLRRLEKTARQIVASRPTFPFHMFTGAVLGWAVEADVRRVDIADDTIGNIEGFLRGLKAGRLKQAEDLSHLLKDGQRILTHCNISGSLVAAADFCRQQGKKVTFIATETRPYLQGSRLTAWELQRAGLDVTLIPDGAVSSVMSQGMADVVAVGADHTAQNGDIANKVGTYQIALLAKHFHLPFYVLCPPPSGTATGQDIRIEIRPDKEMLEFGGTRLAPKGAKGYYPAFDITPTELITRHLYLDIKMGAEQ